MFDYTGSALKNTDTDRNLFLAKKQCFLFEKRRFPGASSKEENCIFSELVDLTKQNKNKIKKSTHRLLGIATYNTCAKFQGKKVNPTYFFSLKFCASVVRNITMPKNLCVHFFCFVFVLFSKIYLFRKNTIFLTLFCRHF